MKFKKFMAMTMLVLSVSSLNTANIFASENMGVSSYKPNIQIETRTTQRPNQSEIWDFSNSGTYYFSGQAAFDNLYTDYMFMGSKSYEIEVTNLKGYIDEDLEVTVYKSPSIGFDKKIGSMIVTGQQTNTLKISNLNTSDRIYIKFSAPSHFEGSISD